MMDIKSFIFWFVEDECVATLSAVMPVFHCSHEDAGAALFGWALSSQTMNLPVLVDLEINYYDEYSFYSESN